ncbi:MAG: GGDEF domain-containing protein [Betaproteobacteria bacterium]|nr:GGDEF domain-containing protein [Betaproteobacteria bacterium]
MSVPPSLAVLPEWLQPLFSVAAAVVTAQGVVVEANQGFLALAPDALHADMESLLDPPLSDIARRAPAGSGMVYEGLLAIGQAGSRRRILSATVYRLGEQLLLVGELDASAFEALSQQVDGLTHELAEAKAALERRNRALTRLMSDLKSQREVDTVTGLPLRSQLDAQMEREISRWDRYRRPLALVTLDIDDFAQINGDYGREVGDEVLAHIATILRQTVRAVDLVVRYGGQEFAVLLPETNEMGALIVAERLRMELETQIILPLVAPVTASFGVASLLPEERRDAFARRCEQALQHSKRHGKNRVTMAGVIDECNYLYGGKAPTEGEGDA